MDDISLGWMEWMGSLGSMDGDYYQSYWARIPYLLQYIITHSWAHMTFQHIVQDL